MKRVRVAAATLLGLSASLASPGFAATVATGTMTVEATVEASCALVVNNLNFGTYKPTHTTDLAVSTSLNLKCSEGAAPKVAILQGSSFDAATGVRTLTRENAADTLDYVLFHPTATTANAACGTYSSAASGIWGHDASNWFVPTDVSFAGANYNICGHLPKGQNKPAGRYVDTVTVNVEF